MGKQKIESDIKKVNNRKGGNTQEEKTPKRKQIMLKCLKASGGIVSTACEKANIVRSTHYEWLNNDNDYKQAVHDINEAQLDFTESMLMANIKSKKEASIFFHLKTKGKSRGYVERTESVDKTAFEDRLNELTDDELDEISEKIKRSI